MMAVTDACCIRDRPPGYRKEGHRGSRVELGMRLPHPERKIGFKREEEEGERKADGLSELVQRR